MADTEFTFLNDEKSVCLRVIERGWGPQPTSIGRVAVHYQLYSVPDASSPEEMIFDFHHESVSKIDDSRPRGKPFNVTMNQEVTIPGLELALSKLHDGDRAEIIVSSSQAFAIMGNPHGFHSFGGAIAGATTLMFILDVLDVDNRYKEVEAMTAVKTIEYGASVKQHGNKWYTRKIEGKSAPDYERALLKYRRAANIINAVKKRLKSSEKESHLLKQCNETLIACYNNMSACWLGLGETLKSIECGKQTLEVDSKNVKGLFRLSKAHTTRKEYDEALQRLEQALSLDSENGNIKKEIASVKRLQKSADNQAKKLYGGMFSKQAKEAALYTEQEIAQIQKEEKEANMRECPICHEKVNNVQYARHVIKYHSDK